MKMFSSEMKPGSSLTLGFIHYYWVRERLDEDNEVLIRMYYEGKNDEVLPSAES